MKTQELETTMPDEAKLDKLASLAKTLNEKTDSINSAIERLEKRLGEMNIGLEVWLKDRIASEGTFIRENEEGEPIDPEGWEAEWSIQIGYAKYNDWVFVSRRILDLYEPSLYAPGTVQLNRTFNEDDGQLYRPLTSAPRAVRIAALPFIEKLVDNMIEAAEKNIEIIDDAASKF